MGFSNLETFQIGDFVRENREGFMQHTFLIFFILKILASMAIRGRTRARPFLIDLKR